MPGLCSKYVGREQRREPEGEACPPLDTLGTADAAPGAEKGLQRASYSSTVSIQLGAGGRAASFGKAQLSLTHPLLPMPEQPSARKVNGSALETPPSPWT